MRYPQTAFPCLPFKNPLNYLQQDKSFNILNFNYLQESSLSILCQTFKLGIDSEFSLNIFQLGFLIFFFFSWGIIESIRDPFKSPSPFPKRGKIIYTTAFEFFICLQKFSDICFNNC